MGNHKGRPRAVPCLRRPVPAQAGGHAYFMGVTPTNWEMNPNQKRSKDG